jgi:hypothetical protein
MKKFTNHVDHVAWVSRPETLEANLEQLSKLTQATFRRFVNEEYGMVSCVDWAAGLEVLAPLERDTEFNKMLKERLAERGEGVLFVVFGVDDLDEAKARIDSVGGTVGPLMETSPLQPWYKEVLIRERIAGAVMNTTITLGDIGYPDGMIGFGDSKDAE